MDNVLSPEKLTHTWLEDALALLFGTLMISFGIILFRQAGALTGGTAGMAFLIHYATHLPFGVVFFAINLPFYWLSVRRMGAAFTLKTFCAVGLVSLFSDLHGYFIHVDRLNPYYATLFGNTHGSASALWCCSAIKRVSAASIFWPSICRIKAASAPVNSRW